MNGTNAAVPMQGLNGMTYYVSPLALMDEQDVPMQGMPYDYTDEDIQAYRMGYLTGDRDALNGLFDKFKERRAVRKEEKAAKKEAKAADKEERKALRMENRRIRTGKRATGTSFLDKFGGALANLGEAQKLSAQAEADLANEGIDFDDEIVAERAALASEAGIKSMDAGGGGNWFANLSTTEKAIGGVALAAIAFGAYKMFSKGRKRK